MTDFISGKAAIAGRGPVQFTLKWELTKTLRIMKLTGILLFIAAMHVSAKGLTQDKITLSLKNAPLEKVLGEIEAQSGFVFIYKDETVKNKKVSIQVTNVSLAEALDVCLKDQALSYRIVGKSVAIKSSRKETNLSDGTAADNPPLIDVKGRVLNEKGEPVEGVTVRVKGTEKVTLTDKNGEFSLVTVERDAELVFTHITMETFLLKVSGQSELLINLRTKVSSLGEVVISVNTGYQTVNKERVIGSAFVIDSALLNRTVTKDIISRLEGIAPGVLFFDKSTGSPRIQIRGISTLGYSGTSQDPLIIVDNFPYYDDLNNINPNDVENITILKDAAAASVWGAKAGNGVIVITTKKGKYNQPFRLSVSTSLRVQEKPNLFYYPQMTSSDFIDVEQFLFGKGFYDGDLANTTSRPIISPVVEILAQQKTGKISSAEANGQIDALRSLDIRNDYNKYVYRAPVSRQDYLNLNGGTNVFKYGLSMGFDQSQSNMKDNGYSNRFTINSISSFKPFRSLEFTLGLGLTQSDSKSGGDISYPLRPGSGKGAIYPYAQLADALGNALPVSRDYRTSYLDTVGSDKLLDWHYRPLDELKLADGKAKDQALRLNFGTNIKFTQWLDGVVTFGYTQENVSNRSNYGIGTYFVRDLINRFTQINGSTVTRPIPLGGILGTSNSSARTYNIRGQLNFNKAWHRKHSITALIAGEAGENKSSAGTNYLYGYNNDVLGYATTIDYSTLFPQFLGGGSARIPNQNTYSEGIVTRTVDVLANASYSYLNRYSIYASVRKDGANIFGTSTNNKWKPLWSAGASWDLSKESFYHVSQVPSLKIRASYGYTGNVNNRLSALTTLSSLTALYGNSPYTQLPMSSVVNPPNPSLRWENIQIFNAAIDFALLNNRLTGTIEWYRKVSKDVIAQAPIDPTTGFASLPYNYANLEGKGIDITLNSRNISSGHFEWSSLLNFSHNKSIVTRYYGGAFQTPVGYGINPVVGQVAFGMYSYKWMGLDPQTGDPLGLLGKQVSKNYAAIINDSVQNQAFNGSNIPLYYGNLLNTFSFKGFSVSFNITYKFDYYFRRSAIRYSTLFKGWNGNLEYSKRWQAPGDELYTNVPSMNYPADETRDLFYANSEATVEKGDNIRLENIRLQLPTWENKRVSRFPVKSAQLSVIPANLNLFIWKASKSGLDPDYSGSSYQLPPAKVWTVALLVNFK
jgi:TonB-linked SusC/RagA family outer membrane protein